MVLLLDPYVDAILALALAFLIVGIMRQVSPYLNKIPWIGGAIAHAADGIAQAISDACGVALHGISAAIGASFHALSRFVDHTYHQLRSHAMAILETATIVGALVSAYHAIKWLVNHLSHAHAADTPRIKRLEKEYRGIEHTLKRLERELRGIDETGVRAKLRSLDKQLQAIEDQTIPALRKAEGATAGELAGLEQWLGIDLNTSRLKWLAGFATAALAAIGLGGMSCDSNPFKNNKNACGLWGDLSQLLGVLATVLAVADFEELVREMQRLEQGVIGGIEDVFGL